MKRRVGGLLVFVVAACLYAPTVHYGFTYDDLPVIVRNPLLHSLGNWTQILRSTWWENGHYRPLSALTLAADWSIGGGTPAVFHLVNALLHGVAAVMVYLFAARLTMTSTALLAALLFAVHPVHVEAVANVVGRAEVLATIFVILSVMGYLAYGDRTRDAPSRLAPRALAALGTVAAALCAFGSKESSFALPGLLLLADWQSARRAGEPVVSRFRRQLPLWSGVVILWVGWLWLRVRIAGDLNGIGVAPDLEGLGFLQRGVAMLGVVPGYVRLLFFPLRLSADYSPDFLPVSATFSFRTLSGLLLLAAAALVAISSWRRSPEFTFSFGWITASLLVVSNLVVPVGTVLAERTLYLPSVGACLVLGVALEWVRQRSPVVALAAASALVLAGTARTLTRAPVWRSNETFFPALVRDAPGSFRAYWVDGMLHYQAGDRREGERLLRKGLSIYPMTGSMWRDLANRLEEDGRWLEAADCFWAAFRLDSTALAEAAQSVMAGVQGGGLDTAEARLRMALRQGKTPELTLAASHLALARGDTRRAMQLRREVALASPETWQYWQLTAQAARQLPDCTGLLEALDHMGRLNPNGLGLAELRTAADSLRCRAPTGDSGRPQ